MSYLTTFVLGASMTRTSNYIPQTLWDAITCPCPRCLLMSHKSSFVEDTQPENTSERYGQEHIIRIINFCKQVVSHRWRQLAQRPYTHCVWMGISAYFMICYTQLTSRGEKRIAVLCVYSMILILFHTTNNMMYNGSSGIWSSYPICLRRTIRLCWCGCVTGIEH